MLLVVYTRLIMSMLSAKTLFTARWKSLLTVSWTVCPGSGTVVS